MSGWDAAAARIDPKRVAELLVDLSGPGWGRRGSGYQVSASAVLTAAHVVRDAARVRVRFNADRPGEWLTEGVVEWSDPTVDAAVIGIAPPPEDVGPVAPVTFGRVADRDAVVACSAMGFPRFKLRDDRTGPGGESSLLQYRDSVHAVGTVAVLSNRRQGTLELSLSPPERDPDPQRSPWEGMSGAAVWSGGRIIGLIAEHHRSDGLGRLAAVRVDRWYERLAHDRLGKLRAVLPELPAQAAELVEVVPPTPGELVQAGYLAQVRDIAPEHLVGREEELAELVRFCAGDERYQWWQAEPWAGKSALAAWFVLHPPAGVAIVSFFVTGRLAGQADSDAFTEAMVEQLAAVAGEAGVRPATPGGWDRERRRLLDLAAASISGRGGRLVLVIDGLDEDEGARPGGKPSIASLLPKRPPASVRVLVFSRPSPGLVGDVPGDHLLRHCARRELAPWSNAQDVRLQAKQELLDQLHGDQVQVDVIGFITAAGGGLSLTELVELIRQPLYRLDGTLASVFGRSLQTRGPSDGPPDGDDERIYLFAHETLRAIAEQELAGSLDSYRLRIDAWADEYRARGWPERTPRYLLRPYGRLLAARGDLQRLVDFATDSERHGRLLASTLGDGTAIAEITTAQQLLLAQPAPDLGALGRLAVHRDRLANRNQTLPVELPGLLVRLGQHQRGEALARGIPSPGQPEALAAVAEALADVGWWDRAVEVARGISDDGFRARALAAVGKAMIQVNQERAVGLLDDADLAARGVRTSHVRPFVLAAVAEAFADAGLWERAEQTAYAIEPIYAAAGARALRSVVDALAAAGLWDRAERTARAVPSIWDRAAAMAALGSALAGHDRDRALALLDRAEGLARGYHPSSDDGEPLGAILEALTEVDSHRAVRLADDVEQAARGIPHAVGKASALVAVTLALAEVDRWDEADRVAGSIDDVRIQAEATRSLAKALAEAGQWDRAEQEACGIPDPRIRAEALIAVAKVLTVHDRDRALALAANAEQMARAIPHPGRVWALQAVARGQAAAGQLELAEQTARGLSHPDLALRAVVEAQAAAAQWDRAEQTARDITEPGHQVKALAALAKAMSNAGQWDRAERTVRLIPGRDPVARIEALGTLAEAVAAVDRDRAAALAAEAERAACTITDSLDRDKASRAVARAQAAAGRWDQAEKTARRITNPDGQIAALGALATAQIIVDRRRALALLAEAERDVRAGMPYAGPLGQARGLSLLTKLLAAVDRERAVALAAEAERAAGSTEDHERDDALAAVAEAQAAAGQWERAEQAARSLVDAYAQTKALGALATALIHGGEWERAEQVARGITDPDAQVRALAAVAKGLMAVDQDRALAVAAAADQVLRSIPDPYDQAKAWVVIAESLTTASATDRPSSDVLLQRRVRHLAEILAGPRWLDALKPLGTLDPAAFSAVNTALHALNPETP